MLFGHTLLDGLHFFGLLQQSSNKILCFFKRRLRALYPENHRLRSRYFVPPAPQLFHFLISR